MRRVLDFLRTDDLPLRARPSYRIELRHFLFWGVVVGAVEGNLAGIVASKTFGASRLLTSIVWATPIVVNILNLFWGLVIRGHRRVPVFITLAACALGSLASVSLTSTEWRWGGWCFAAQLGLTHIFFSGLLTLRSSIWRANYPRTHRARITGRLQTLRLVVVLCAGAVISSLFDRSPAYYRYVYPLVVLIGLLSLIPLFRLRIQGEPRELRAYRARRQKLADSGARGGGRIMDGLRETLAILKRDVAFRRYMLGQFFLGAANFFTEPVLLTVLVTQIGLGYFASSVVMVQIPMILMLVTIRYWARYFDRVGVVRFRVLNSSLWLAAYACVAAAMWMIGVGGRPWLFAAISILVVSRVINGVCRGGGQIAWNIGHLHFARDHQVELYMGIHVALTGMRGLLMPILGGLANEYLGNISFAIAIPLSGIAVWAFKRVAALERDRNDRDEARNAREPGVTPPDAT